MTARPIHATEIKAGPADTSGADAWTPPADDRKPTEEELYLILTENGVEYVDGHIRHRTGGMRASQALAALIGRLGPAADEVADVEVLAGGMPYRCFPNQPHCRRKPNLTIVRRSRLRAAGIADDDDADEFAFPPDLAVEGVGPDERAADLDRRLLDYEAAGFPEVWVLWPRSRTVTVVRGELQEKRLADDVLTLPSLLPVFRMKVGELFPHPGPADAERQAR